MKESPKYILKLALGFILIFIAILTSFDLPRWVSYMPDFGGNFITQAYVLFFCRVAVFITGILLLMPFSKKN